MSSKRGVARESARAIAGLVGIGVAALAIAGATWLPLPSFSVTPPSSTVVPVPSDQQRVCPGPLLALAADSSAATKASAVGIVSTQYGTSAGSDAQTQPLAPVDDPQGDLNGAPQIVTVPSPSASAKPPLIAAAQTQTVHLDDFAGFAAASCGEADSDSWLVAGATTLGQTSLVLLSNPSTVQATVDLTIYSETGPVSSPGSTGIVVAAGTQRIIPLAGLAPNVAAPVVHVVAVGGRILASMEQSDIVGIDPRGVELAGATRPPAQHQVIAGMAVRSINALVAAQSGEAYGSDLPAVRVLVPGTEEATIRVGAVGETGTSAGNSYSATVKPGVVTEIPLDHLIDGNYTVSIDSTKPIVAAARTSTVNGKAHDFGWFVASDPVADTFLAAIPAGPGATLHFASSGEESPASTVKIVHGGTTSTLKVPGGGAAGLSLPSAGMYTITGAAGLYVSTSFAAAGSLSSFAINPPGPLASPIVVYPK